MNEFTTVFLFTDIGDYQTRVASWTITIVSIPVVCLFLFVLLNLRIPQPPNGKVYIRNTAFPTINLLGALIAVLVGAMALTAIIISLMGPDPDHKDPLLPSIFVNEDSIFGNPEYADLQQKYYSHQYFVTEGTVHVIQTENCYGHKGADIVRIGDVEFIIDDYGGSGFGYGKTSCWDGALTEGTYARVFYVERPPDLLWMGKYAILKVDIKNK